MSGIMIFTDGSNFVDVVIRSVIGTFSVDVLAIVLCVVDSVITIAVIAEWKSVEKSVE